ncbi:putative protein Brevis radix-like 3 [Ananas comosus]|uniref:Uncharacterized protein n=1 Tax=Ananas comosus TaxID=4615 RepID=A0A199V7A8_ANACO|nr:putative protein Brevis radix-like 3 [Ananas comosus]
MLACIACTKEGGEDSARAAATPSTKDAVKSLTTQASEIFIIGGFKADMWGPTSGDGGRIVQCVTRRD